MIRTQWTRVKLLMMMNIAFATFRNLENSGRPLVRPLLLLGFDADELTEYFSGMASQAWFENGYYWREDRRGNVFWLDGKRWKRFERPTVLGAAGEAASDTAAMAYLSALIAYAGYKKVKSIF